MRYTVVVRGVEVRCDKPEDARALVECMAELREAEECILAKYSKPVVAVCSVADAGLPTEYEGEC